jgi:polyhydroxyalkanoate synthesis regulator phasin
MTNPLLDAFFVGRAVAEVLSERLEHTVTDALSELGKFDAEAREHLRHFTDEVLERANRAAEAAASNQTANGFGQTGSESEDLQAMVDDLRAEIATLRTELQHYRSRSTN